MRVIACLALVLGCQGRGSVPVTEAAPPVRTVPDAGVPDAARPGCAALMAELRGLRDGPQPCATSADCIAWHNGEHWDGCPREVNLASAARLDELRRQVDAAGCPVEKGALCNPRAIRGCVSGGCGGAR
jgi:hypothetical protein